MKDVLPLLFHDFLVNCTADMLERSKDQQISKLITIDRRDRYQTSFRAREQLLSISQSSRPEITYVAAQLCQIEKNELATENVKLLSDTVWHTRGTTSMTLKFKQLHKASPKLYIFVDSGYNKK